MSDTGGTGGERIDTGPDQETTPNADWDSSQLVKAGAALVAGVVVPGLASRLLHAAGYGILGTLVFAMGFTAVVIVAWYAWLRPIDLTGPIE